MKKLTKAAALAAATLLVASIGVPVAFAAPEAPADTTDSTQTTTEPQEGDSATQAPAENGTADGATNENGTPATDDANGDAAQGDTTTQPSTPNAGNNAGNNTGNNANNEETTPAPEPELSTECPLPVTNTFNRSGMTFTVTTNCPQNWDDVPAVLFSSVISQGNNTYTYSYRTGESATSYVYQSVNGGFVDLTPVDDPQYAVIPNGRGGTDVKVVNKLQSADDENLTLTATELFTVTTNGNLKHTVTYTSTGSTPVTGAILQTLDTDLNGDDHITVYANGHGGAYIASHDFTLTAEKLDGTARLLAGRWNHPETGRDVSSLNGVVSTNQDTSIFYESGQLNLAQGASYTMSFQETVYKAGEDVPDAVESHTLNFNTQGGSAVAAQQVTLTGVTVKPANPTRSGYTFVNWTTDKEGKNVFEFGQQLTEDTTIYAQWKKAPTTATPAATKPAANKKTETLASTGSSVMLVAALAVVAMTAGGAVLALKRKNA
ncbi:InlB B-repeat-containing protein [Bifidobacterium scaligerum]|uniref:Gram-positive cocci surface proteins LPxTG domain-containing protein n=1 Tax=Bifidobacterium scaligerum TaxID=2052656 RepID=A0A2M9HP35_9BIFI|nr:InlB B-repeat-containing protein [Bifidobacterium scaligerum]PJM78565.1 hypothetical protein CUU80_08990 [Bifidobacterium scaligerum]